MPDTVPAPESAGPYSFDEAIDSAAACLRQAEADHGAPELTEASARVADRWLTLASLLRP